MQHDNPWQHLDTKIVYEDEWVVVKKDSVVRPDSKQGSYTYIDSIDAVMVVAINDNSEIYLEWTYRYPIKSWGWELPGGGANSNDLLGSARSELDEEAGLAADTWSEIANTSIYNGLVTGMMHYFKAEGLHKTSRTVGDDSEITNTGRFFSVNSINEMIMNNEIKDSHTIAGIHLLKLNG